MRRVKIAIIVCTVAYFLCWLMSCDGSKIYAVEITYCDGRKPIVIQVIDRANRGEPNNNHIHTFQRAVPTYQGQLNVCSIKNLGEVK